MMGMFVDKIDLCIGEKLYHQRGLNEIMGIAIHRTGKDYQYGHDFGDTAEEVAAHFIGANQKFPGVAKTTGGKCPYTLIIEPDGTIAQCLPIIHVAPHARHWSREMLGIAVIGDFRHHAATADQANALINCMQILCMSLDISPSEIKRHDQLHGGSGDPSKVCPGDLLCVESAKETVAQRLADTKYAKIERLGLK